jgi:hypothetical protein
MEAHLHVLLLFECIYCIVPDASPQPDERCPRFHTHYRQYINHGTPCPSRRPPLRWPNVTRCVPTTCCFTAPGVCPAAGRTRHGRPPCSRAGLGGGRSAESEHRTIAPSFVLTPGLAPLYDSRGRAAPAAPLATSPPCHRVLLHPHLQYRTRQAVM